ncbi:hypothetical protein [Chromobacterium haemolyticum]|uniref:hypothetical protein n=1 Tax=Chromobacterium haemolyticum TaxID=394935 RepID=UPI0017471009|nr:hypothetical protein [Chromobacterium haemolyticum]QOD81638.1 hypothetical protein IEZ30_17265 [Chromobacterium haemolyticum]
MNREIISFAVGVSLMGGKFGALLLKFKLKDQNELLTAWAKPHMTRLMQALAEYHDYIQQVDAPCNPDSVENTIRSESPLISQDEITNLPVSAIVNQIQGHVRANHNMEITIGLGKSDDKATLTLSPNGCEWLLGFIANTLNNFSEDGDVIIPSGIPN